MKKSILNIHLLLLLIFLFAEKLNGQNYLSDTLKRSSFSKPILSSEIFAFYPYVSKTVFNYGYGGAITAQIKLAKYSLGFNYNTLNHQYVDTYYDTSYLYKHNIYKNQYNIPFLVSFPLFNKNFTKKNDLILGFGLIWHIPIKYEHDISFTGYYPGHSLPNPNHFIVPKSELSIGKSFDVLVRYQRKINKFLDFYSSIFLSYKFKLEYYYNPGMMGTWRPYIPENRGMLGLSAGIELYYNR